MQYLTEARKSLASAKSNASSASLSGLVKNVDEYLAAAQVVTNDQKKNLDQIVEKRSNFDVTSGSTMLASLVAVLGTLSSIILSWRKDVREAKAELEKLKAQMPKIVIP